VDNLRLKVAVVSQLTTCSGKLFQAFMLRHTNELERRLQYNTIHKIFRVPLYRIVQGR